MHTTPRLLTFGLIVASSLILQTCSDSNPDPTGPNSNPTALLVTPSSGAPGTLLSITGYTLNPSDTGIELLVGDQPTTFTSDSSGIHALIPLFLDTTLHWPAPPLTAQDVAIHKDGEVVALATAAVTVDSLPHADGSTAMLQADFAKLTNSLRTIYSSLPTVPGTDPRLQGYQDAVMAMLDSLVAGADSSLESILSGSSSWTNGQTPDLALLDAILASSGALDFYNQAAGSLGRLTDSLTLARQQGLFCKDGGPDMDLACQMQIYVVLDDYATYFVKPTTAGYANTVGLVAGILAIGGIVLPPEKVISGLLTVFDFVYGTLAPSLFPAEISDFSLAVETDTVGVGEMTSTTISISAVNHPSTVRATDVLETLITALGFANAPSGPVQSFREVLVNAMKWALGLYRKAVEQYNAQNGNSVFIDPEAPLPSMSWGPVIVTNPDLVKLYSLTEDIITTDTGAFEWKGVKRGEGRIQARARGAGERSKVLLDNTLCFGCIYAGGAFGNNAPGTETKTVVVGKPASIDVQIIGLPSGIDGNVVVVGTNYSSGQLTSSKLLKNLDLGDYTMTAVEVRDNSGDTYKPDPLDATVTLQDGDEATIKVNYKPKYGNLFLTVTGLSPGTDADINVNGPNSVMFHVVNDTLVDSLEPGDYTISANSVQSNLGATLEPLPKTQTVTITSGETATASVNYSGVQLVLQYGRISEADVNGSDGMVRTVSSASGQIIPSYDPATAPLYNWLNGCWPDGGILLAEQSFSSESAVNSSAAKAFLSISQPSPREAQFSVSMSASGAPPPVSTGYTSVAASMSPGDKKVVLRVDNPGLTAFRMEVTWNLTWQFSNSNPSVPLFEDAWLYVLDQYQCQGQGGTSMKRMFDKRITNNSPTVQGADTLFLSSSGQRYMSISTAIQATGGGITELDSLNNKVSQTYSSSVNGTITFRVLK